MSRQAILGLLIVLNAALLIAVLLAVGTPSAAFAQRGGTAGSTEDFALICCRVDQINDAMYVLDARNDLLHCFRTPFPRMTGQPVALGHVVTRDLSADFARGRGRR